MTITDDGEEVGYEIASADDLEDQQIGYAVTADGKSLTNENGGWLDRWLVIGFEELTGDPVFVDIGDRALPVLTAMHGAGKWEPLPIAPSLGDFLNQT